MVRKNTVENPVEQGWDEAADVVVAGGSYAGLAAAVAASEKGAGVMLLEKGKDSLHPIGRDGKGFVGMFAVESSLQKQAGIDLTRDWAFRYAVEKANWRCNAPLVRRIVDESAYLIEWLREHGVTFSGVGRIIPHHPRDWHYFGEQSHGVIRALTQCAGEKGVKLLYQTQATGLLASPEGRIIGVKALAEGGELRIKASRVILATGGMAGFKGPGAGGDESDGIRMARGAGAALDFTEQYQFTFGLTRGIPFELSELQRVPEQPFLFVNRRGERVFDEGYAYQPEMLNVAEVQPDGVLIQIFDEDSKNRLINQGVKFLQHGTMSQKLINLDVQIEEGLKRGLIERADTIKELAAGIMVPPENLGKTVAQYNGFCRKKHDDVFLKDPAYLEPVRRPPFYAIVCDQQFATGGPARAGRNGGVRITADCRALDSRGEVIPGLYAAGKDAAGMYGNIYPLHLCGVNMTFEIDTGRIAGESAAADMG